MILFHFLRRGDCFSEGWGFGCRAILCGFCGFFFCWLVGGCVFFVFFFFGFFFIFLAWNGPPAWLARRYSPDDADILNPPPVFFSSEEA